MSTSLALFQIGHFSISHFRAVVQSRIDDFLASNVPKSYKAHKMIRLARVLF
jgi:hypothetical protein